MRIAISGGSGSLGTALLERLVADGADRLVTFTRDEQKRAALDRRFGWHPGFRVMAGDVRDASRLADLFRGCEVVIHGAARKVVTAHPDEAEEMLKTNVIGTQNVIEAAKAAGVQKVVLISSDKAVRAENVYGVSKAMAEWLATSSNSRTFCRGLRVGAVRYGNVLGSTGSVLPIWRAACERGEPIVISAPSMTRFWITMPQAVDLVLNAVANLRGGEIVVPKLPCADLQTVAEACQLEYGQASQVIYSGVRQGGEKFHEELLSAAEVARAVERNDTFVIPPYQNESMWDNRPWLGTPVDPALVYRSDVWSPRLDVEGMRALLRGL